MPPNIVNARIVVFDRHAQHPDAEGEGKGPLIKAIRYYPLLILSVAPITRTLQCLCTSFTNHAGCSLGLKQNQPNQAILTIYL